MKILLTGSAGFIGFHVAKALLARGDEVVGLDNFNPYYSVKLKEDRTDVLTKYPNYKIIREDLMNADAISNLFAKEKFGTVCNLAAQAGVRYSLTNPEKYINSNISGFLNILEGCRHNKIKKLVYASSSSVYGGNKKLPFSESDPVDNPVSLYAATKKGNELLAHSYTSLFGIQTIGLRFFSVYGPWGRPDVALWVFTEAILNNKPIQVFNHGNMKRDFTYVDDIVQGVIRSIDADNVEPYEIINLGNHSSENLLDTIKILEEVLGKEGEKVFLPMQPGDIPESFADIARAQTKLGFKPTTNIREGIKKFVEWYLEYHHL
jgi:UDP-glucuronate 4-epimerase